MCESHPPTANTASDTAGAKRIVVAVSDSAAGRAALAAAMERAATHRLPVLLVRVWREAGWLDSMAVSDVSSVEASRRRDEEILREAEDRARALQPSVSVTAEFVVSDDLYPALLTRTAGAELIALGCSGPHENSHVGEWLRHRAHCAVLLIDEPVGADPTTPSS